MNTRKIKRGWFRNQGYGINFLKKNPCSPAPRPPEEKGNQKKKVKFESLSSIKCGKESTRDWKSKLPSRLRLPRSQKGLLKSPEWSQKSFSSACPIPDSRQHSPRWIKRRSLYSTDIKGWNTGQKREEEGHPPSLSSKVSASLLAPRLSSTALPSR